MHRDRMADSSGVLLRIRKMPRPWLRMRARRVAVIVVTGLIFWTTYSHNTKEYIKAENRVRDKDVFLTKDEN